MMRWFRMRLTHRRDGNAPCQWTKVVAAQRPTTPAPYGGGIPLWPRRRLAVEDLQSRVHRSPAMTRAFADYLAQLLEDQAWPRGVGHDRGQYERGDISTNLVGVLRAGNETELEA